MIFLVAMNILSASWLLPLEKFIIYHPTKAWEATPADWGLLFEDIFIRTGDGLKLHGWWIAATQEQRLELNPKPALTIAFFHGNAGNISSRLERASFFHKRGYSVFLFDYRGYGKSEGKPTEEGLYLDAAAVWNYLTTERKITPSQILLFGESLGCAVVTHLAQRASPAGIVLEAPFTNVPDMARSSLLFNPLTRFVNHQFDSLSRVPQIQVPKLFYHGTKDSTVPMKLGRKLFEAASPPKEWVQIEGGSHNDLYIVGGSKYWEAFENFIQGHR